MQPQEISNIETPQQRHTMVKGPQVFLAVGGRWRVKGGFAFSINQAKLKWLS